MVIEFTPDVFEIKDFKAFNHLFQLCTIRDRYEIVTDYVKIAGSSVFKRMDFEDQELIIRNFDAQMTKQDSTKKNGSNLTKADYYIDPNPTEFTNVFNLEEATVFFNQKISIILENSLNDSHFIKAIIEHFDSAGSLKLHLRNKWFTFENAGGCTNVENFVNGKLDEFQALPKDAKYYFRGFVLLDSDRESPDQHINHKHGKLLKFLKTLDIPFHVLEKRMMENYMPDEVIDTYSEPGLRPWINAYLFLSPEQKDFLAYVKGFSKKDKAGFPSKRRNELEPHVVKLYSGVSDKNFDILDLAFKLADFKEVFPLNFTGSPLINPASLSKKLTHQKDNDEFNTILSKINKLI